MIWMLVPNITLFIIFRFYEKKLFFLDIGIFWQFWTFFGLFYGLLDFFLNFIIFFAFCWGGWFEIAWIFCIFIFLFFWFLLRLPRLILKVTNGTTEHQNGLNGPKQHNKLFYSFSPNGKKSLGWSSLRSGPYLLVYH